MQKYFVIIGGDTRLKYLKESLEDKNIAVDRIFGDIQEDNVSAFNKISSADVIVFPVPISQDKLHVFAPGYDKKILIEDIVRHISPTAYIFGGGAHPVFENQKRYINLLEDEVMTLKNAMATAEAALSIIISRSEKTVAGSKITVLGFGRIGKIICRYLAPLNAEITVCARKSIARAEAEIMGYQTTDFESFSNALNSSDIIINTVPFPVITKKEMLCLKGNVFILDLASKPGGIDFSTAKMLGINYTHALSLPGKYSPKSAAEYIEEQILSKII